MSKTKFVLTLRGFQFGEQFLILDLANVSASFHKLALANVITPRILNNRISVPFKTEANLGLKC
jgi:hypothetical protein